MKITFPTKAAFVAASLLVIVAFSGCKTTSINAEKPLATAAAPQYQRKISTLNIPVTFRIKQLEARLNQELNGVIYRDDKLEGDNIKVTVSKNGRISLFTDNDLIYISFPIHVWAMGRWEWQACDLCPKFSKSEDTQFDMVINCQTSLSMNQNWQIVSRTTGNYEWGNQKPHLEIGPLKIPLAGIVDLALKPQLGKITARFDQELQSKLKIKDYIAGVWKDIQQPVSLHPATNTWLVLNPLEVSMSTLKCQNDEVNLKIGIRTYIETISGNKPAVKVNPYLPPLKTDNRMPEHFTIGLSSEISYAQATELVKKEVLDKTFSFNDNQQEVTVRGLEISGNGEKLQIRLDLEGKARKGKNRKIKGTVYLQGIPYYDAATQSVKVRDFGYELNTRNLLLKTAGWLLKTGFDQRIKEMLDLPVKEHIEQAKLSLQEGLDQNGRIAPGVLIKGKIQKLEPEGIYLTPTAIKAVVNAEGYINVLIDRL